ncbi:30S ribosome-binding factor RbfA [Buchnera aphidicola (Taiwanaphis decaspermi)]|uniref:30S ribosome-binding factor RbfA n=1 Tax=Buchnera aphidicola TaxID=9 RepID=UPI0031B8A3B1
MKKKNRIYRISNELQKTITNILYKNINDPKIKVVNTTISDVKLSSDLSQAKIFVSFLYEKKNIKKNINILQKYSKYIRMLLSKYMTLRIIPKLFFIHDDSLIEGCKISNLIKNTIQKDKLKKKNHKYQVSI